MAGKGAEGVEDGFYGGAVFFAHFGKKDEVVGEEKVCESWATSQSFNPSPIFEVDLLLDKVGHVLHAENEDVW